jgi:hypothetical protein
MDISSKDFIKLTTQGYPLELHHSVDEFYNVFTDYVNMSNENNFFAELTDNGVTMHAGMKTEVCTVSYEKGKVIIRSFIVNPSHSSTKEFEPDEETRVLGYACLGILYFCNLYSEGTGQQPKFKEEKDPEDLSTGQQDIWPL